MKKLLLTLLIVFLLIPDFSEAALRCTEDKDNSSVTCVDTKNPNNSKTWHVDEDGEIASGAMEGCVPLATKLTEFSNCTMCPMYRTIFNTANSLITKAFESTADSLRYIMSIVFAVLLAGKTLAQVSSYTSVSAGEYLEEMFKNMFKFFVAFVFLTYYKEIFYWVFNPLLTAGIDMGAAFLANANALDNIQEPTVNVNGGFFSVEVYKKIDMFSQVVQQELAFMQAVGSSMMCISFNDAASWKVIPDGSLLISGGTIYLFAISISVAFGFYLVDSLMQLCVVGILTPFSVAAYPFNFSQEWMKTTWKVFLDTFLKFVFVGLIISIITEVMAFAITAGAGGYEFIINAMNENDSDTIASFFDVTSIAFLTFIVCSIYAKKLLPKAAELADSLSGGSIVAVGAGIGGTIAGAATKVGKRAGSGAKKAAGNALKNYGKKVKEKAGP